MPRRVLTLLVLLAMVSALPGCNLIGAAAIIMPKPPVPAQHELPDKKTLIIVEDRASMVRDTSVVRQVTASIRGALEEEEVVTTGFVPQTELTALQTELGEDYGRTSLGEIARRLGAEQLIYAKVIGYQLEMGGGVFRPMMAFEVKVIDMELGARSFPRTVDPETGIVEGQSFVTVVTEMQARNRTAEGNAARAIAARELADQAGIEIARLFHSWKRPEPGDLLHDNQP
ncbi:MAG: hypothetical protein ACIAXF_12145 [Phycisphaerales bacterium JB063]